MEITPLHVRGDYIPYVFPKTSPKGLVQFYLFNFDAKPSFFNSHKGQDDPSVCDRLGHKV